METFYQILGVPENASSETIRQAYIVKAKQFHPDSANNNDPVAEDLNEKFIQINKAYRLLRDSRTRQEYDAFLRKRRLELKLAASKMKATANKPKTPPPTPEENPPRQRQTPRPDAPTPRPGAKTVSSGNISVKRLDPVKTASEQFEQVTELLRAGNLEKARDKLRWAIKLDPHNARYCSYLAFVNVQLKSNLHEAHLMAQKAIQLEPSSPLHHYHLGLVYLVAGHDDKAKLCFRRALELDPDFPDAQKALQRFQHKESFWKKNLKEIFG
jgi:curved DNA-binding protein CbpA